MTVYLACPSGVAVKYDHGLGLRPRVTSARQVGFFPKARFRFSAK